MVQKTSIDTYYHIKNSGILSDKRLKVYEILYEHPEGLTGSQVSDIFKSKYPSAKNSETIRNRITELKNMNLVMEMGIVDCEFSNRKVMKFCLTDNLPTKLEKIPTLNEKINSVLEKITLFAVRITKEEDKVELRNIYKQIKQIKK